MIPCSQNARPDKPDLLSRGRLGRQSERHTLPPHLALNPRLPPALIPAARPGRILSGMKPKPKSTYVTASPQTWELIRAAYLSGLSGPTVAARFGVSVTALRKRAMREG